MRPRTCASRRWPTRRPGPNEVEVRIEAGGICGSDLHYYLRRRVRHGAAQGADDPRPRDRRHGQRASARRSTRVKRRPARRRQSEPPVRPLPLLPGGQAEPLPRHALLRQRDALSRMCRAGFARCWCATPRRRWRCRPTMSAAQAAFAEPFAVCLHAVNRAGPLLGKRVLVTGAGPIGALTVIAARRAGALEIVATDVADAPLAAARKVGADEAINVTEQGRADALRRRQGLFRRDVRGFGQRRRRCRRRSAWSARRASWCRSASRAAR